MRVGEGKGGTSLAEYPVTRGSAPRAAYFSQWRAGDIAKNQVADWGSPPYPLEALGSLRASLQPSLDIVEWLTP
jgi:hypothetical protein